MEYMSIAVLFFIIKSLKPFCNTYIKQQWLCGLVYDLFVSQSFELSYI